MKTHIHPSKLTQSLQLLTPPEFKSLHKWLQSPWANPNKKLVELYRQLQKHHPDFTSRTLTKENLFAQLYPGKNYDDKWMRNIMAALCKQVDKFLVHERLEKEEVMKKRYLAQEFLERHQNEWSNQQADQLIKILESKKIKETEDYLMLSLVHQELYHQSRATKINSENRSPLLISDLYLDTFYSISKWRHLTELVERQMILPENLDLKDKIDLLSLLTKKMDIPVANLFRERIYNAGNISKDIYFQIKEKFLFHFEGLSIWDRKLILMYLTNDAIRLWMSGDQQIMVELFELFKFGMEHELLQHNGRLTEHTYANIVTTANSLEEFEYAEYFIENYTDLLPPISKADGKAWAMGHWNYKQNNYEATIKLLANHIFKNDLFARNGKTILLQSYFDACLADDSYLLFFNDFCAAFKKYIKRIKSLTEDRKQALYNTIRFTEKILKYVMEKNKEGLESVEYEIKNAPQLQAKLWLLDKLKELKKGLPK